MCITIADASTCQHPNVNIQKISEDGTLTCLRWVGGSELLDADKEAISETVLNSDVQKCSVY